MQAPGPPELVTLPVPGLLGSSIQGRKIQKVQALGSSNTCLRSGAGQGWVGDTNLLYQVPPWGSEPAGLPEVKVLSLQPLFHALSPTGRRIDALCVSRRQTSNSCRTIDRLSALSYLPYFICEKNCNYPQGVIGGKVYKLKRTGNGHLWLQRKHFQY